VSFDPPEAGDRSATVRFKRRVLCYRALLAQAGLQSPDSLRPDSTGLFSAELLDAMKDSNSDKAEDYRAAATVLAEPKSWKQLASACRSLREFIHDKNSGYREFDRQQMDKKERVGKEPAPWA